MGKEDITKVAAPRESEHLTRIDDELNLYIDEHKFEIARTETQKAFNKSLERRELIQKTLDILMEEAQKNGIDTADAQNKKDEYDLTFLEKQENIGRLITALYKSGVDEESSKEKEEMIKEIEYLRDNFRIRSIIKKYDFTSPQLSAKEKMELHLKAVDELLALYPRLEDVDARNRELLEEFFEKKSEQDPKIGEKKVINFLRNTGLEDEITREHKKEKAGIERNLKEAVIKNHNLLEIVEEIKRLIGTQDSNDDEIVETISQKFTADLAELHRVDIVAQPLEWAQRFLEHSYNKPYRSDNTSQSDDAKSKGILRTFFNKIKYNREKRATERTAAKFEKLPKNDHRLYTALAELRRADFSDHRLLKILDDSIKKVGTKESNVVSINRGRKPDDITLRKAA